MASFSDNFNRANSDSLGANWTEQAGDQDIVSNTLDFQTSGFAENLAIYSATPLDGLTGYARVDFTALTSGAQYAGISFRYTNSSTEYYRAEFAQNENTVTWYHLASVGGTTTEIANSALTVDSGDKVAITWEGTGNDTVVRVWRVASGGTLNDTPFSVSAWNDGSDGADVTFTNNPANPVDSGGYVGLGGFFVNSPSTQFDNFFAGDIGGAPATTILPKMMQMH